ncbi:MAG: PAS domain S-box protein, partial [Planctomycetes bacterium]|nr:PAS domain S-box protein [Planctomycetota bacterium]
MRKCRHDLVHGELAELAWRDLRHSTLAEEVIVLDAEGRLESCGYHKNGHCHFEASAACAMARPDQGREEIAAVLRGDRDEAQFDYTSPDGDRIYLARVIPRSGGGAVISHVDITARRQLEERLRLAAALFDSSDEMHLVADADGTILLANSAAEGALGFAAGGLQGLRARDVVERAFLGLYGEQIWNQLQHEGHWNGEAWLQRKGGGTLPVWGSIRAVRDGRYRGRRFLIGAT